ncbi:hypothetical protein [Candidatus Poriferisodalis sp.]|uniref:hypothetical protein n=1 Tax=Candidatus Poriferisodalis sp. TaxID=3101277 RepID=UPI003B027023
MSTTEAPTSPAQQSPSRWRRVRSRLGLCIAWLVLLVLGVALPLLLLSQIVLDGRTDLFSDAGIGAASGLTVGLICAGLRELWRRQRRREAEAANSA